MISQEQAKKLDNYELCEELRNRLDILSLCVEAISSNHSGTDGLFPAFDEVDTIAREMRKRLPDCPD